MAAVQEAPTGHEQLSGLAIWAKGAMAERYKVDETRVTSFTFRDKLGAEMVGLAVAADGGGIAGVSRDQLTMAQWTRHGVVKRVNGKAADDSELPPDIVDTRFGSTTEAFSALLEQVPELADQDGTAYFHLAGEPVNGNFAQAVQIDSDGARVVGIRRDAAANLIPVAVFPAEQQ